MTIENVVTVASASGFVKDNSSLIILGAFIALTALTIILKLALPKIPKEALTIFVGADHLYFKAKPFQEKNLLGNSAPKTCEDMKIELYKVNKVKEVKEIKDDNFSFFTLSDRQTLAGAPIQPEEPIQIRFKYKDGLFWTAWSQKIKKTIRRPPFQLQVYTENLQNHQQPAQTEENFYDNLCQEFRQRINNAQNVRIIPMGRIGTGKSSLINTLFSAFTTNWRVVATTYGQNGTITKEVTPKELVPGQVHVVDMPGWQNNSAFHIMGDIVRGVYDGMQPDMQQIDQRQQVDQTPGLNQGPRGQQRNAIIFVVAAEDANGDDVNQKILKEIIELGYPCIAVVTKVDNLGEEGEESITSENFYTDPRVINCCHKLKSLGIDYILPMINYSHQAPQNSKINYVALHALDEAIRLAR